jgi:hypothetical protein
VSALSTVETGLGALFSALMTLPEPIELTAPAITVALPADFSSRATAMSTSLILCCGGGPPGVTRTARLAGTLAGAPASTETKPLRLNPVRIAWLAVVGRLAALSIRLAASTCAACCCPDTVLSGTAERTSPALLARSWASWLSCASV